MLNHDFYTREEYVDALRVSKTMHTCHDKLSVFVKEMWDLVVPNDLIWNWHMDVLCDEIQEADERVFLRQPKDKDIIINIPPGTSKTKIVSVMSTAWEFGRMPGIRVFVGSYSDKAVSSIADDIKLIMKSEKYQRFFPDTIIRSDMDSLHNFKTTANGEFYAFTVGGSLTSKHADILKIDDPINPKQATSEAELYTTNNFFDKTLPTRKVDKKVTITYLIMQRLSAKDPTGHLLEKKADQIHHICLPGTLSENVKPAKYKALYSNGLLDENRLTYADLATLKIDLGSYGYAGQIDQSPAPEGGLIWQKWFKEVPDHMFPDISSAREVGSDWDTAFTDDEDNAASAYVTSGEIGGNIFLFDLDWRWLEFPELIKWMRGVVGPHYVEAKATGKSAKQTLSRYGITAIEIKVEGGRDKVARARASTPLAESGVVYIKKSMAERLYHDSKQGILAFPRGQHKDLADALAQALQRHLRSTRYYVSESKSINSDEGRVSRQDMLDLI